MIEFGSWVDHGYGYPCGRCSAFVYNREVHEQWHRLIRDYAEPDRPAPDDSDYEGVPT